MITPLLKPKRRKSKPSRTTKNGRIILSEADYKATRIRAYEFQGRMCFRCHDHVHFENFTMHHQGERGLGGSRRNDVFWGDDPKARMNHNLMIDGFMYGLCMGLGTNQCHESVDRKKLYFTGRIDR